MKNKHVLVTGGGKGIGLGIVRTLAQAGFEIGFCGRSLEGAATAQQIEAEFGVKSRYYQSDISDLSLHDSLLDAFETDFGSLDALVNNAGVAPNVRADLLEMVPESFERVLKINLEGPFFLTQNAARRMTCFADGKFRAIINIGSVSASFANINRGEYCMSKAAVAMATKLFAVRLAAENIAVYEIRPGVIKSDMTSVVSAQYDKMIADGLTLQRRWGEPEDIGKVVKTLLSGDLAYSTGQVIHVDGGLSIERF